MSTRSLDPAPRLLAAIVFLIALWTGAALVNGNGSDVGHAAPPAAADASHQTPTPTATATATPTTTPLAEKTEPGLTPFLGFGASTMYAWAWPDLCRQTLIAGEGEVWVLSRQQFFLGDPGVTEPLANILVVQRCVGIFQPPAIPAPTPTPISLLPVEPIFSFRRLPTLEPMLPRTGLTVPTPTPWVRPPVLVPVFPDEPILPPIPTLEVPEDWQLLPPADVALRTPDGREIALAQPTDFRPDQWTYTFDALSEPGTYTVVIRTANRQYERPVQVIGLPRLATTDRFTDQEAARFPTADSVVLNYLDFQPGREVTVRLYRLVDLPAKEGFTQDALAPITHWRFIPTERPMHELVASHLDPLEGPAFGTFVVLACYTDECNQLPRISLAANRVDWPSMAMVHFFVKPSGQAVPIPAEVRQLRFPSGATSALIDLTLSETGSEAYLFAAAAGQTLHVEVSSPNIQLYLLDANRKLILPDAVGVGVWEFTLPASGRYILVLFGREDVPMFVEIPPPAVSEQPPLEEQVLARLAEWEHRTSFPDQARRFARHLIARLDQFQARGLSPEQVAEALRREDVGIRITGIVQAVWSDWLRVAQSAGVDPEQADPALYGGLSPFRQLVIRLIQDRQGPLSEAQQAALYSFLTRGDPPHAWWENANGIIAALNREFFNR